MKTGTALTWLLLLTALPTTEASANYFYNPHINIARNIGSAPSPTPRDIRENRLPEIAHVSRSNQTHGQLGATQDLRRFAKDRQTYPHNSGNENHPTATPAARMIY
jgi:hypothetical protein